MWTDRLKEKIKAHLDYHDSEVHLPLLVCRKTYPELRTVLKLWYPEVRCDYSPEFLVLGEKMCHNLYNLFNRLDRDGSEE